MNKLITTFALTVLLASTAYAADEKPMEGMKMSGDMMENCGIM